MKTVITITLDSADLTTDANALLDMVTSEGLHDGPSATWDHVIKSVAASAPTCVTVEREGGWLVGWNMPGYLPDDEPQLFESFDEAREYLLDELERAKEDYLSDCTASDDAKRARIRAMYNDAITGVRAMERTREGFVRCGKYVWWIRPEIDPVTTIGRQ